MAVPGDPLAAEEPPHGGRRGAGLASFGYELAIYHLSATAGVAEGRYVLTTARTTAPARGPVGLLAAGHAVDDLYQGAVPALLPFFAAAYGWRYTAISGITVAATLLSSVVQPLFGLLTDRRASPWLVPAGMAVAGTGIGAAGLFRGYALVWLAVAVSGLGVAAYHPESARLARLASAGSHQAMSWFSLGGNLGFAAGPLVVSAVLGPLGLAATPLLAVPALGCALLTAVRLRGAPIRPPAPRAGDAAPARDDWTAFLRLTAVIVCRSVLTFGLGTFLALFVAYRLHGSRLLGEAALVTFYGCGALGTVWGGRLAGRYRRVSVLRAAYLAAIPATAGIALVPGPAVFAFVAATALAVYVPFSLHVTLGQDYLPSRMGTASGVTLGLAVSLGGVATPALGALADARGLGTAMAVLVGMPVLAALLALRLRQPPAPFTVPPGHVNLDG
ncbi:MAG TPA: MFS transporter [Rugosimonospora sp.]|nr:MFS transporter [Rugosimonospora sp.]